jgi:hypothetical protein
MLTEGQYISGPHTIYSSSSEPFLVQIHLGLTISVRCHHPLSVVFWCNRALSEAEFHFKQTLFSSCTERVMQGAVGTPVIHCHSEHKNECEDDVYFFPIHCYKYCRDFLFNKIFYCLGIFLLY